MTGRPACQDVSQFVSRRPCKLNKVRLSEGRYLNEGNSGFASIGLPATVEGDASRSARPGAVDQLDSGKLISFRWIKVRVLNDERRNVTDVVFVCSHDIPHNEKEPGR